MEAKLQQVPQKAQTNKPNLTGIPTQMKLDFEQRSGLSFDDVRVHYNSDKPAQLQALAYTQGTQVYVGPGQQQYLPHELGHVIQQKRKIVGVTGKIHNLPVNISPELEHDADKRVNCLSNSHRKNVHIDSFSQQTPIQGYWNFSFDSNSKLGVQWTAEEDVRPEFSKEVTDFFENLKTIYGFPKTACQTGISRNHIISAHTISLLLKNCILKILNNPVCGKSEEYYKLPVNKPSEKTNRIKGLRRIIKMVIQAEDYDLLFRQSTTFLQKKLEEIEQPNNLDEHEKDEHKEEYQNMAIQQKNRANLILNSLDKIFESSEIDLANLQSLVSALERLLVNSVTNIRLGDTSTNSSLHDHIDPLADTFSVENNMVLFNDTDVSDSEESFQTRKTVLMSKRLWKLYQAAKDLNMIDNIKVFLPIYATPKEYKEKVLYTSDELYGRIRDKGETLGMSIQHFSKKREEQKRGEIIPTPPPMETEPAEQVSETTDGADKVVRGRPRKRECRKHDSQKGSSSRSESRRRTKPHRRHSSDEMDDCRYFIAKPPKSNTQG